jgi:hypothetical protein
MAKRKPDKSTAKGNKFEIEVRNILESAGWKVFRQHRKPMFIKGRMITVGADIFGCDMICKKDHEKTLWIQVSTISNKSAKIKQVYLEPWNYAVDRVQVWCRIPGKKFYQVFEGPDFGLVGEYRVK